MNEIIRKTLEKYLTDNGAAPICITHLEPMTKAVVDAIAPELSDVNNLVTGTIEPDKPLSSTRLKISMRTISGTLFFSGGTEFAKLEAGRQVEVGFRILPIEPSN